MEPSVKLRHVSPVLRQEGAVVMDAAAVTATNPATAVVKIKKKEFMMNTSVRMQENSWQPFYISKCETHMLQ